MNTLGYLRGTNESGDDHSVPHCLLFTIHIATHGCLSLTSLGGTRAHAHPPLRYFTFPHTSALLQEDFLQKIEMIILAERIFRLFRILSAPTTALNGVSQPRTSATVYALRLGSIDSTTPKANYFHLAKCDLAHLALLLQPHSYLLYSYPANWLSFCAIRVCTPSGVKQLRCSSSFSDLVFENLIDPR